LPATLASPAEGATPPTARPTFDWGDVPGAASYTLQVSQNATFTLLSLNTTVAASNYTPLTDLLPKSRLLYWRVLANGLNGPSVSEMRSFTSANPPGAPVLSAPANGALVNSTPTLTWLAATLPAGTTLDHYEIQIAADSVFTAIEQQGVSGTTGYTATSLGTGLYYWRVRAYNTAGQYGQWSAARRFRVP
jgi:hypothetical protein